jgi:hypothetical protein
MKRTRFKKISAVIHVGLGRVDPPLEEPHDASFEMPELSQDLTRLQQLPGIGATVNIAPYNEFISVLTGRTLDRPRPVSELAYVTHHIFQPWANFASVDLICVLDYELWLKDGLPAGPGPHYPGLAEN